MSEPFAWVDEAVRYFRRDRLHVRLITFLSAVAIVGNLVAIFYYRQWWRVALIAFLVFSLILLIRSHLRLRRTVTLAQLAAAVYRARHDEERGPDGST